MNKLYIVLIIIFIICLFNLCNDLYEGHPPAEQDPHITHGSCDCNPAQTYNYRGSVGRKCHTRPAISGTTTVFPLTSRDPRGGGENRDRVRDFCRGQGNMSDCNNATYPRASGIVDWGGPIGTCVWSGEDVIYHPHSNLEKLKCGPALLDCGWINNSSLISAPPVNIPESMKNNININRDTLINSPEFQTFLREENKQLSDFTGSSSVLERKILTEEQIALYDSSPELVRQRSGISSTSRNYVSVLVTGSDNEDDIGKIYKSQCISGSPGYSICPRGDDVYNNIINKNNVISLGTGRNNPNYAYGVILYWE
jgi:hypothetical protein